MSDKKKIIDQYRKKVNDFKKHNDAYFNKDKPVISGLRVRQKLKSDILKLESKFPF